MDDHTVLGDQYAPDDPFRKRARLHQSRYRAEVLRVPCDGHGNKLRDDDGRRLLAYYDGMGVREAKMKRYPEYSKERDGNLLRSEHIPFNLFGPLIGRPELAKHVLRRGLGLDCASVSEVAIEWAPPEKQQYLDDATSFDAIVWFEDDAGRRSAAGIEVKYTEGSYRMGDIEGGKMNDPASTYETTARNSGAFFDPAAPALRSDSIRQFWRNHLLGLAMVLKRDVDVFHSLVVHPAENPHCEKAIPEYQAQLTEEARARFRGVSFEEYIGALDGDEEVLRWKAYLGRRYIVGGEGGGI